MKKKLSIILFGVILFASISSAFGYHEFIYSWEDDGAVSVGCHGSATASENGTLVLTLNFTGTIETLEKFNVTVDILNFTEAIQAPYDNRTTLGIGGEMGDNPEFSSPMNDRSFQRRKKVDEFGSQSGTVFILFAPATPGTYTLGAVAIAGMNQSDEHAYAQVYVEGSIEITVVAPEVEDPEPDPTPAIPGFQALYIVVPIAIVAMAVLLKRKVKTAEN